MASFMEQIRGGRAKFDPERIVITAGATAANELILEMPCLSQHLTIQGN